MYNFSLINVHFLLSNLRFKTVLIKNEHFIIKLDFTT